MVPLSENAKISVLTCANGEELYTTFGHTAIRIQDVTNNLNVVFNYGMFDFSEGNFYLKFVKGDLQYYVAASSYDQFLYEYQLEKREVIEQTLNLSRQQKQNLLELLTTSLYSEEKYYTYKFIDRNCTTMVVDKLNTVLGDTNQIRKSSNTDLTYRETLYPYFENYFWYKLGINIIFGQRVDDNATQLFLPIELLNSLNKISIDGKPLVASNESIVKAEQPNFAFNFFNSIYFISSILLVIILINKRILFTIYLIILGFLGIFFIWVGSYSLHKELLLNYNILLFNPIFLLIPFIKSGRILRGLLLASFGMLLVYLLVVLSKPHLNLVLPFMLTTVYILIKKWFGTKKLLASVKNDRT
jgi:hypothetical protein